MTIIDPFNSSAVVPKITLEQMLEVVKTSNYYSQTFYGYKSHVAFRNYVRNGGVYIGEWADAWKQKNYDAPMPEKESTYEDCVDCEVHILNDTILITIWEGDMMHGQPTEKRCTFKVEEASQKKEFLPWIQETVHNQFAYLVDIEFEKAEKERIKNEKFLIALKLTGKVL